MSIAQGHTVETRPRALLPALGEVALAAALLLGAAIALRVTPFRYLARWIEKPLRRSGDPAADRAIVNRVAWAIGTARRRLPKRPLCLSSALAANRMLAWRGVPSELWLGVPQAGRGPGGHAWLLAAGCLVTGGTEKPECRPLHTLVTPRPGAIDAAD